MSGADAAERQAEAKRWLAIGDQDIATARICIVASPPLTAVAAYHCQQAVEKILKALLVAAGAFVPKTHDLAALNALAARHFPAVSALVATLEPITVWGYAFRYPPEEESGGAPKVRDIERRLGQIAALRQGAGTTIDRVV
jgi:HEPN domain-containing protein